MVDTFETAVMWDRLESLHTAIIEEVSKAMQRVCGVLPVHLHVSRWLAPYYTLLAPIDPGRKLEQWREIKRVYDPDGIMNPGVLFEPES